MVTIHLKNGYELLMYNKRGRKSFLYRLEEKLIVVIVTMSGKLELIVEYIAIEIIIDRSRISVMASRS